MKYTVTSIKKFENCSVNYFVLLIYYGISVDLNICLEVSDIHSKYECYKKQEPLNETYAKVWGNQISYIAIISILNMFLRSKCYKGGGLHNFNDLLKPYNGSTLQPSFHNRSFRFYHSK